MSVSVNVAVRQLREPDFVDSVRSVLRDTGLDPRRLILEVTEADIIYDTEPIIGCLSELRTMGVRIALDDFGTGHSSLSRLRDFPVDVLKIDRSFTASLCGPTQSIGFAHSVFNFGVGLGLSVIAEGVETEECLRELGELGCGLTVGCTSEKNASCGTRISFSRLRWVSTSTSVSLLARSSRARPCSAIGASVAAVITVISSSSG